MQENVLLRSLTTFNVGGPARFFLIVDSEEELTGAVQWANEKGIPFFLLGGGSNILVADEGFPGLVIKLGKVFSGVEFGEKVVTAEAATPLPRLGNLLSSHGWSGFEFMCGIPGTVGGAVAMNAGTKAGEIKHVLTSVRVMQPDGRIMFAPCDECGFGYRRSRFGRGEEIILSATFALDSFQNPEDLRERVRRSLTERATKQPRNSKNCGSVFKSSSGLQAWVLIDKAGFRGVSVGDAMVATEHSNWIINKGKGTSVEVKKLIRKIQTEVEREFGIHLEREILFVPEDILPQVFGHLGQQGH